MAGVGRWGSGQYFFFFLLFLNSWWMSVSQCLILINYANELEETEMSYLNVWGSPKEGVVQVTDGNHTYYGHGHIVMYEISKSLCSIHETNVIHMPTVPPFKMFNEKEKKVCIYETVSRGKWLLRRTCWQSHPLASQGTRTMLSSGSH